MNMLELEIAKERACFKDVIKAINRHFAEGHYDLGIKRINDLKTMGSRIKQLEAQLKAQRLERLFEIASKFTTQGQRVEVVTKCAFK